MCLCAGMSEACAMLYVRRVSISENVDELLPR
jgi:hypothetical protein